MLYAHHNSSIYNQSHLDAGLDFFPFHQIFNRYFDRQLISAMPVSIIIKIVKKSFLGINSSELKWVTSSNRTFYRQIKLGPKAYFYAEYSTLLIVRTIKQVRL